MKRICLGIALWILPLVVFSQQKDTISGLPGRFQLGVRSTTSLFSHGNSYPGFGVGGHFRMLVHERINTEWFADVILTDIEGLANRQDYHIGWSVMFYILKPKNFHRKFLPYVVAGHCFDWTRVNVPTRDESRLKFSSAIQMGAGVSYNITPRWDLSLTTQYMMHLGEDLHAEVENGEVHLEEHAGTAWEGHMLISLSINYKIAQLWKPKKR